MSQLAVNGKNTANSVQGSIDGTAGEVVSFEEGATPVNQVHLVSAATGARPRVEPAGGDTNASLELRGKGTGGVAIGSGGAPIAKSLTNTATWDPGNMAADGSVASTTLTVTGAAVGDVAHASLSTIGANDVLITAHVQAADTVRVVLQNKTGGALDIASGTLRVVVLKMAP